ncbi:MFS transporter [Brochothrix campestris]|nr:MFS transporter [Brochothrix campestris]
MLLLLCIGWGLGNLDRTVINYAIIHMADELTLSATQTGWVLSAFFLGYALMQIPGGILADKIGAKVVLVAAVLMWSIFTGLTAIAGSFVLLVIIRFLFGIGEGGFQPAAAKVIASVFPKKHQSKAMSLLLASAAITLVLVPLIGSYLIVSIGWRLVFVCAGLVGLVVTLLYRRYIDVPPLKKAGKTSVAKVFKSLLHRPLMWLLLGTFFAIYAVNWGLTSWLPKYLTDIRGLALIEVGLLQLVPGLIMLVCMFCYGVLIDKLSLQANKQVAALFATGIVICLYLMFFAETIVGFIVYQSLIMVFITYIVVLLPSILLKALPQAVVGTAMGIANTGGQLAGFATPVVIGFLIDYTDGSYVSVCYLLMACAAICVPNMLLLSTSVDTHSSDQS